MKVLILLLIFTFVIIGCADEKDVKLSQYEECVSACSMGIDEPSEQESAEFIALHLCNEECKKKFLK